MGREKVKMEAAKIRLKKKKRNYETTKNNRIHTKKGEHYGKRHIFSMHYEEPDKGKRGRAHYGRLEALMEPGHIVSFFYFLCFFALFFVLFSCFLIFSFSFLRYHDHFLLFLLLGICFITHIYESTNIQSIHSIGIGRVGVSFFFPSLSLNCIHRNYSSFSSDFFDFRFPISLVYFPFLLFFFNGSGMTPLE